MDIAGWRKQIDEMDGKLVELLNQRARAAKEIGRLKRDTNLPVYEPEREKEIYRSVRMANRGPLLDEALHSIYERIIDVMRNIQKEEILPHATSKKDDV
ncbi:MAG: chorismate mutase [Candidatus Acidiferrum sp.]